MHWFVIYSSGDSLSGTRVCPAPVAVFVVSATCSASSAPCPCPCLVLLTENGRGLEHATNRLTVEWGNQVEVGEFTCSDARRGTWRQVVSKYRSIVQSKVYLNSDSAFAYKKMSCQNVFIVSRYAISQNGKTGFQRETNNRLNLSRRETFEAYREPIQNTTHVRWQMSTRIFVFSVPTIQQTLPLPPASLLLEEA